MAQAQVTITAVDKTQAAINSAMRGLKGLGDQAGILKRAFAGIGAAAVAGFLTRTASAAIQYGDELQKASIKSGIATEALSSLAYAAKQSDIDLGSLSMALRKMQIALSQAASGGQSQKEALDALGISLKEIKALNPERQFELIADRISMLTDPADRARAATEIFGKAGADLLPMFESGAEGIRKAREEAERLGIVLSTEQAQALADSDDAVKRLTQSWGAFSTKLTAQVAPALTTVFDVLSGQQGIMTLFPGFIEKALGAEIGPAPSIEARAKADEAFAQSRLSQNLPGFIDTAAIKKAAEQQKKNTKEIEDALKTILDRFSTYTEFENDMLDAVEQADIDLRDRIATLMEQGGELGEDIQERLEKSIKGETTMMTEFARTAASNIQTAFANFLFDPFQDGLRGMLAGFGNILRRMVAEIAAQQLLLAFFNMFTGGTGIVAQFANAAVSQIEGKAAGGPVSTSRPYIVGERGPELFVPNTNGGIVSNDKFGMGGVTVAPVYNIDARGATADLQKALPSILSENNRRIFDELDRRYGIGR